MLGFLVYSFTVIGSIEKLRLFSSSQIRDDKDMKLIMINQIYAPCDANWPELSIKTWFIYNWKLINRLNQIAFFFVDKPTVCHKVCWKKIQVFWFLDIHIIFGHKHIARIEPWSPLSLLPLVVGRLGCRGLVRDGVKN